MLKTAPLRAGMTGFTLVELLVAILVLAILLGLGAPSFRDFILRGQIRSATDAIENGIQLARAEAVRRNLRVRFVIGSQSGQSSWTVSEDTSGTVIQQSRASGEGANTVTATITPAGASTITFNSFGRITANADGSVSLTQVELNNTTAPSGSSRRVVIGSGGAIRLCNPDTNLASTDPTKC